MDKPVQTLNASSCMLLLTSSGTILFVDSDAIQITFEVEKLFYSVFEKYL